MGVAAGDVCPAGSQQQHPPQSIQVGIAFSGMHIEAHMDASPVDAPPELVDPPFAEPPVEASLFPVPCVELFPPVPPSDSVGEVLLLQAAASPTVEDAPLRTRT
jgi:hypothetical protein